MFREQEELCKESRAASHNFSYGKWQTVGARRCVVTSWRVVLEGCFDFVFQVKPGTYWSEFVGP